MIVFIVKRFWYSAICLGPFVIIRERDYSTELLHHETIHYEQQKEMLFVFAYIWYLIEFLLKSIYYFNFRKGYEAISFEREAVSYANIIGYLSIDRKSTRLNSSDVSESRMPSSA